MKTVLVLDDDVALAELMRVVLEDAGYATTTATDATDLPRGPIDCVVTDLMTVNLYTREDARDWVLRLRDRYPSAPIIVVTAHSGALQDAAALGVRQVIMKPFDVDQISAAVRAVVGT